MEVIYAGMLSAEEIIATAVQEHVDVIGLNIGGRYGTVKRVLSAIEKENLDHILVIAGGSIPPDDIPLLKEMGVKGVFPPGSTLESIVQFVRKEMDSVGNKISHKPPLKEGSK
jgi:methylmalonyl-CoA mutase C-terminal domain/subunit